MSFKLKRDGPLKVLENQVLTSSLERGPFTRRSLTKEPCHVDVITWLNELTTLHGKVCVQWILVQQLLVVIYLIELGVGL